MEDYEEFGACSDCGESCLIYKDTKRCDSCDGRYTYCDICNEEQHEDDTCRHVFKDCNCMWQGSGALRGEEEGVKASFTLLVGKMPKGFAEALTAAIAKGKFYSFLVAPLIGSGGHLTLNGLPLGYGEAMIKLGESDDADEMGDGYKWLASLYQEKTPEANTLTLEWLKEVRPC